MVEPAPSLSIDELDVIAPGAFAAAAAPLFEGARGFLGRLAVARPFGSVEAMFRTARDIAHAMPLEEQLELIDAHPRLGASPDTLSSSSHREQGYAGAARPPDERPDSVAADLTRLNDAYEAHFGFRYCVFVAGRPQLELIPDMERALGAAHDAEIARAIDAVVDIAHDRYERLTR